MTPLEAAALCRFTKAVCPQQAIDEYTPDAWHLLLEDLRFEDAKAGVVAAGRLKPFVSPAEIREQVRRMRSDRIRDFGPLPLPPDHLAGAEQLAWTRELIRRIGDGEDIPREPELQASPEHEAKRNALLAGAFQTVPADDEGGDPA